MKKKNPQRKAKPRSGNKIEESQVKRVSKGLPTEKDLRRKGDTRKTLCKKRKKKKDEFGGDTQPGDSVSSRAAVEKKPRNLRKRRRRVRGGFSVWIEA